MQKSYQTPCVRFIKLSSESLMSISNFLGNTIEDFGIENQYSSTKSNIENFGETNWGSGGASNEGFTEKNIFE